MNLRFLELFAGAGGMSLGLEAAGMSCVGHAEIEPHARAVLRHRWPDVPLYGDVTTLDGAALMAAHPFDVLTGGSPCQDLSVAGKRAGLAGARSGLFHHQVRIWTESGAPYLLWENVLGALSSNGGKDFAEVLSTLVGAAIAVPADGWRRGGVAAGPDAVAAWRVLDVQHVPGLGRAAPPQRRVRVFVLAARAGGVDPAEVLALGESVCGHPAPRGRAREGTARGVAGGAGGGGAVGTITGPVTHALTSEGADASEDGTGRGTPIVVVDKQSGQVDHGVTPTLKTDLAHDMGPVVVPTLAMGAHTAAPGSNGQDAAQIAHALLSAGVGRPRRLTPLECERLMAWRDGHTAEGVDEQGSRYRLSDTARYRLCGNGIGATQAEWIGRRLVWAEAVAAPVSAEEAA